MAYDVNLEVIDHLSTQELASLLPSSISRQVEAIPQSVLDMSFEALEKKIPDALAIDASRARIAFWLEFERCHRTGIAFNLGAVYAGLMNYHRFQRDIISNSYILAYLITPPPAYHIVMEEMMHFGLRIQREILQMSHFTKAKNGDFILDLNMLKLKNTIIDGIHDRLKGLPVSKNLNISKTIPGGEDDTPRPKVDELDARIRELEAKPLINVTPKQEG